MMTREEILDQLMKADGLVPEWLARMTDPVLEHWFALLKWYDSDTALTARDKNLIGYGAAVALGCPY
jgi:alkylhydroperoxidase/carboxymuconolactone decarboxylase family protein YurZ